LSKDSNGHLTQPSTTLKNNLKTYLSQYRTIGDNIEIRGAYVINIGVNFEIIVLPDYNNNEVLLKCINELRDYFNIEKWQINQPILLRDLYVMLDRVEGVQTVKNIQIVNKAGFILGYSQYEYDIVGATQNQVIYPSLDPSIFEIKFPTQDIKGQVVPL
jgi:phage-related baseplate assembly protein